MTTCSAKAGAASTATRASSDMHDLETVKLGCIDCHGGNADAPTKEAAHVQPCLPHAWPTSANPVRSYTLLNHESPEFIRFVNPGDLRVAHISCGACHAREVLQVHKSMMTHGCMLWGSALYNNGAVPNKWPRYGESYSMCGAPQRVQTVWKPDDVAADAVRSGPQGRRCRFSIRCRASKSRSRATCCAFSSTAAASGRRSAFPSGWKSPAARGRASPTAAWAPKTAPTRSSSACKRRGCSIRRSISSAPTISRATIAPAAARPATSSMPTTARPCTAARTPNSATWALAAAEPDGRARQERRSDDSQGRAGPSDHAPLHRRHADEPVHRLPHSSRHQRAQLVPRLHVVGQRNRRRADVSAGGEEPDRRAIRRSRWPSIPTRRPPAAIGPTRSSSPT